MRQFFGAGATAVYRFVGGHKAACTLALVSTAYVLAGYSWLFKPGVRVYKSDVFGMLLQMLTKAVIGAVIGETYQRLPNKARSVDASCAFVRSHKEAHAVGVVAALYVLGGYSWFIKPGFSVHTTDVLGMLVRTITGAVIGGFIGEVYKIAQDRGTGEEGTPLVPQA